MAKEKFSLKDDLFNKVTIKQLSLSIKKVYLSFEEEKFFNEIMMELDPLELKERITLITNKIKKYIDEDYPKVLDILLDSLKVDDRNTGFVFASYSEYVETYGCSDEYLDLSLYMLCEYTKNFSAEFAIRAFINKYPDETYNVLLKLSKSSDTEQRRFASEGLRQKLPWASGITFDYKKGSLPLNNLYYDKERYVTRSVANHLNDISKIDPDFVIDTLSKWKNSKKQNETEINYIINHSLRTLIKKGHVKTLEFLGYKEEVDILIENLTIRNPNITIGDTLEFEFEIKANEDANLIVDYIVTYPTLTDKKSEKVFKLKKVSLKKSERLKISKKQAFRLMTTKKLYAGGYQLTIQINGKRTLFQNFSIKF